MEKPNQTSKISKFVKSLKGTLIRQKTVVKEDRPAPPRVQTVTLLPPVNDKTPYTRSRIPLPLPPLAETISQLPYYHPHLTSKDDLTNFMSQYSLQEGYFLLRQSFKEQNSYTITVNNRCGLKHIRVIISNGRFSLKDRSFETIDEMIQFYSHREIPNEENIPGILLKFPIRRPPVEFGDYIVVSNGTQSIPTHPVPDQHLGFIGKQCSVDDRPQPLTPRLPVPLPRRVDYSTTPRKGSLNEPPIPSPPAVPFALLVPEPTALRAGFTNGSVPSTPIGPPSANDPFRSTPIGPSSTNDPILSTPVGPSTQPVGHLDTPSDAFQNERCDCGLLLREAALPLGWSVHVSHDYDTKGQLFFMSPSNETHWDLPLSVALRLSPEQQDLIRNLGFDSDIKGDNSVHPGRPRGCLSIRLEGETLTNTWVPCNDYESSKSLREALQRRDEPSSRLHNVLSDDSENPMRPEHTPNADSQHPSTNGHVVDEKGKKGDMGDDCAATFATDNKTFSAV